MTWPTPSGMERLVMGYPACPLRVRLLTYIHDGVRLELVDGKGTASVGPRLAARVVDLMVQALGGQQWRMRLGSRGIASRRRGMIDLTPPAKGPEKEIQRGLHALYATGDLYYDSGTWRLVWRMGR